jgi:putative endonuclease
MRRRTHRNAERLGRRAEFLCTLVLRLKGWRILARHWKSSSGEIDIIARRGRILAFIEVKARGDAAAAAESLTRKQQARIARAASQFMAGKAKLQSLDPRFDIMLVVPWRLPLHVPAAWSVLS